MPGEIVLRKGSAELEVAVHGDTVDVTSSDVLHDVGRLMGYMSYTRHASAIAAPQLGIRRRLYVVREGDNLVAYHNPVVTHVGERTKAALEGCLSFYPDTYYVTRAKCVRVEALDVLGERIDALHHGYDARIHQHELDHLDGVLIDSRGSKRPTLRRR